MEQLLEVVARPLLAREKGYALKFTKLLRRFGEGGGIVVVDAEQNQVGTGDAGSVYTLRHRSDDFNPISGPPQQTGKSNAESSIAVNEQNLVQCSVSGEPVGTREIPGAGEIKG